MISYLADHAGRSQYILGLEPSCTAVPRSDAPDLLADHPGLYQVRDQSVTLAELLMDHTPGWQPPWLATSASRGDTARRAKPVPSRCCCRGCAPATGTPWNWPTGSPAGPRSTSST